MTISNYLLSLKPSFVIFSRLGHLVEFSSSFGSFITAASCKEFLRWKTALKLEEDRIEFTGVEFDS